MPLRELSEAEAAYVAGIIDGEGTITLTCTHRGEGRRPVVSISSTELPLLQYIRSVVGAGRITGKARFFGLSVRAGTNRSGRSLIGDDDDRGNRAAFQAGAGRP